MAGHRPCDTCESLGTGICRNNRTCECFNGFLGIACTDPVTSRPPSTMTQATIGAIIAGILGGALLTLIIGLVVYFIWKRRVKKKPLTSISSNSTAATSFEPVIAPALYDLSSSGRGSSVTSASTVTYHLYEDLP